MNSADEQICSATVEKADHLLKAGQPASTFAELKDLVIDLKGCLEFGLARKLLAGSQQIKVTPKHKVWITQQHALCTYKDEELLPAKRFVDALALLESIGLRSPETVDHAKIPPVSLPETLALGGAVYKRMFEYSGKLENLHNALALYRQAWDRDPVTDKAYGGVNAAYVLDMLASRACSMAARTGTDAAEALDFAYEAYELRQAMKAKLPAIADAIKRESEPGKPRDPEKEYWYIVTVAEIHFGLMEYEEAGRWLAKAKDLGAKEWKKQTTFRQLVSIAKLQGFSPPPEEEPRAKWKKPWQALAEFLGTDAELVFSCWRGKVGLALSGGGFRASFFHLGVMARLAEMDVLRGVDVLSTVSGGSIVGAYYYLELQNLLKTKEDKAISREDYILIVRRMQEQFLCGVQENLRTRALTNISCNLKMIFSKEYGRSHRMGELYEQKLYGRVGDAHPPSEPRTMTQLLIEPEGDPKKETFRPKFSNWRRRAKVPVLLLNTTSLNSGHNWHFTASWMGEPPGLIGEEVDMNVRYRRLYYSQAPTSELRNYRLGYAVAASACVPALFDPLVIKGLYPGRTIRLVDGGVHDNQGVQGLLDESCTFILCSDASGQMDDSPSPSDGILGVPLRTNSILQDRVREAEYQDLQARVDNHSLQGLFFIHLKQGLSQAALDWVQCQDPQTEPHHENTTSYNVDRDLQRKLAAMRTDLDSFSEVEAYSLILSGYLMTKKQFEDLNAGYRNEGGVGTWGGFDVTADRGEWPFLKLEPIISKPPDSSDMRRQDLGKQIEAGSSQAFKVWKLSSRLRVLSICLLSVLVIVVVLVMHGNWRKEISFGTWQVRGVVIAVGLFLAGLLVPVVKLANPQKATRNSLIKIGVAFLGWAAANIHIYLFDPIFKKRGKLERLLNLPDE